MAVPLSGGETIDPHGGRADLEARVLRVLGPHAYASDPLRALRLVRLAAELGLKPDPETERLTAAAAPRLGEPSPERVFAELRGTLIAPGVLSGLELAGRLGVLGAVLPELTALEGVEQSRFHHLDVFGHTIEVLRRLIELEADLPSVFGDLAEPLGEQLSRPLADDLTRGQALRLAALFHDVAKPVTRGTRADGKVTFIGHDAAGDDMVGEVFRRLRTSERLRAYVGKLTREHLVLGFLVHERPLDARAVHSYLRRTEPVEVEVTVLSVADRLATRGEGQEPWIDAHLELGREVMRPALDWRAHGPPPPPLRGDELAQELGMQPGPELGELLKRLEEAVYAGEVTTREEAVAHARRVRQNRAR
jgi:tRNA nucleotidyltransferase/poly(A) polymerase